MLSGYALWVSLKNIMVVGIAVAALSALLWLALRSRDGTESPTLPPPRAVLTSLQGPVEFTQHDDVTVRLPAPPQPLTDGDTVTTGENGACDLTFSGNTVVHMGPDTSVVIGAQGAQGATLGAVLLSGSATLSADAHNVGFKIGTPVGVVDVPKDKLAEVSIHFDQGFKVLAGEVNLTPPKSSLGQVVLSGQEITLDSIKLTGAPAAVEGLTLDVPKPPPPPVTGRVQPRGGRVQLRPKGAQAWQRLQRSAAVSAGDVVRVAPRAAADVTLDDTMHVQLGPRARFELKSSIGGPGDHSAQGELSQGPAEVAIDGVSPKKRAGLTVSAAQVDIEPTVQTASVEMTPEGARTGVRVRFGAATLPGGTVLHAGNEAWLQNGAVVEGPKAAYPEAVPAAVGAVTEIFYDAERPPVRFTKARGRASQSDAKNSGGDLQWSHDKDFAAIEAAETMTADTFARDRLPDGRSYFRVTSDMAAVGELVLAHDDSTVCADCRTLSNLSDTGEKVVLRYENQVPQVRLSLDKTLATGPRTLLLFQDSDLKTPIFEQPVTGDSVQLPDAYLKEGTYHWYVATEGAASARAINTLKLERDVVTDGLQLTAPRRSMRTKKRRLVSTGRVSAGSRLQLNGKAVQLAPDGSFRVPVTLTPGHNRLIYRVTERQKHDMYYLRDVTLSH